jgi:hypothetical protein
MVDKHIYLQLPENYNYSNLQNALSKPSTISIDEAGFYVTEYPRYGYALKGTKVIRKISHKVLSPARKAKQVYKKPHSYCVVKTFSVIVGGGQGTFLALSTFSTNPSGLW